MSTTTPPLYQVSGLATRPAGGCSILAHSIHLTLDSGQLAILLADNGRGKSVLLRALAGGGEGLAEVGLQIWGRDLNAQGGWQARSQIGLLPAAAGLAWNGQVNQWLDLGAELGQANGADGEKGLPTEVAQVIGDIRQKVGTMKGPTLSSAWTALATVAWWRLRAPALLLLDEPYAHLDNIHGQMMDTLVAAGPGRAVFIAGPGDWHAPPLWARQLAEKYTSTRQFSLVPTGVPSIATLREEGQ